MVWRLLPTISAPMSLQMALDELLFSTRKKEIQAPVLRFYVSSEPWISVGYSFRETTDLSKSDLIRRHPRVPVCRRMTGGGCVLHGRDLIFSLIARYAETGSVSWGNGACPSQPHKGTGTPAVSLCETKRQGSQSPLFSVRASYQKIHESVKTGLERCGLDPKFYDSKEKLPKGSDCFDFPVESDLSWRGQKIAGGAQRRSDGVLLHHESVRVPPGVDRGELIQALRRGFETVFGVSIQSADFDPEIYFQAERIGGQRTDVG